MSKKAFWIMYTDEADYEYGVCSECGYRERDAFPRGDVPNYCSNCGAQMIRDKTDKMKPSDLNRAVKLCYQGEDCGGCPFSGEGGCVDHLLFELAKYLPEDE